MYPGSKTIHEQIQDLLSLTRNQLSMYEHWLKAAFLEARKTMDDETAWRVAKAHARKARKRDKWVIPEFTDAERRRIIAWQPRTRKQGSWAYGRRKQP